MKNKEKIICNYCGGHDLKKRTNSFYEIEPYGEKVEVKEKILKCMACGEEINYTYNYTKEFENAVRISEESSVRNILDYFNTQKIKLKEIEESLGLPIRTLSRWKNRMNYSKIGLTLLRIVRSYPWIIYVAARRFDKKIVDEAFKKAAMEKFDLVENKELQTIIVINSNVGASFEYKAKQTNLTYPYSIRNNNFCLKQGVK